MKSLSVEIVRYVDDHQPGWVECRFRDAAGCWYIFDEKVPIVTKVYLSRDSDYPQSGTIECEVLEVWTDGEGRSLSKIDTSRPSGIESREGLKQFVVLSELLRSAG